MPSIVLGGDEWSVVLTRGPVPELEELNPEEGRLVAVIVERLGGSDAWLAVGTKYGLLIVAAREIEAPNPSTLLVAGPTLALDDEIQELGQRRVKLELSKPIARDLATFLAGAGAPPSVDCDVERVWLDTTLFCGTIDIDDLEEE